MKDEFKKSSGLGFSWPEALTFSGILAGVLLHGFVIIPAFENSVALQGVTHSIGAVSGSAVDSVLSVIGVGAESVPGPAHI